MMQERTAMIRAEILDDEIRDTDYGTVYSVDDVFVQRDVSLRSNVRFMGEKMGGYRDWDDRRTRAAQSKPGWLRLLSDQ